MILTFSFAKEGQKILYYTVYKEGITTFFSKELLLGKDRSCVNVAAVITASFEVFGFIFRELFCLDCLKVQNISGEGRWEEFLGGLSVTHVDYNSPRAQQKARMASKVFPGVTLHIANHPCQKLWVNSELMPAKTPFLFFSLFPYN